MWGKRVKRIEDSIRNNCERGQSWLETIAAQLKALADGQQLHENESTERANLLLEALQRIEQGQNVLKADLDVLRESADKESLKLREGSTDFARRIEERLAAIEGRIDQRWADTQQTLRTVTELVGYGKNYPALKSNGKRKP